MVGVCARAFIIHVHTKSWLFSFCSILGTLGHGQLIYSMADRLMYKKKPPTEKNCFFFIQHLKHRFTWHGYKLDTLLERTKSTQE